jgi:hypothetical protein
MIEGMEKVSKIKLEKIEETIKRIKMFNINLKKFREKESKEENLKNNIDLDNETKIKSEIKADTNKEKNKKKINQESSLINNNGFNTDNKAYIPLNILKNSFIYLIFIFLYTISCLLIIFSYSIIMVKHTNQLSTVENYIFGKLIMASKSTIEIKCFISESKDIKKLNNTLSDYDIILEVIRGINIFPSVYYFYNNKFLLDACAASFEEIESEEYKNCLKDPIIITTNNTENLLKLIEDLVFNIEKQYEIYIVDNIDFYKKNLFNEDNYKEIEKIFFKYFINVETNFVNCLKDDLSNYLDRMFIFVVLIIFLYGIIMIIFSLITRIILINKLMHYLCVSRCIMKIIPTSIIISTPELETWIENKY